METIKVDGRRKVWNRQGKGENGLSRPIKPEELTANDIALLKLLDELAVLDSDHLFAHSGLKSRTRFVERLRLLSDAPNEYIRWPQEQLNRARYDRKSSLWARARRGSELLKKMGFERPNNPYTHYTKLVEHQYIGFCFLSSLRLGGAKLETHHLPPIEVEISLGDETRTFNYRPDFFNSIVFETGKGNFITEVVNEMTIDRTTLDQPSFIKEFLALKYIVENRLYEEWGWTNFLAVIVSPYPDKIAEMKRVVARETNGKGMPWLLFVEAIGFKDPWRTFKPNPEFYTGTLDRAGTFGPFSLSTPPKRKGA